MSSVLVTFLGKGRREDGGYRTARYRFPGGRERRTPYFGLALLEELAGQRGGPVDRLVVLGTVSSIWGALLGENMADADLWCELADAAERGEVGQDLLDRAAGDAARVFTERGLAREVVLRLIPFGRDQAEQMRILAILADSCGPGRRITLDLSHGFRHLPMLGLLSAMFLRLVHGVEVDGLYYGALEMSEDGLTPVLRLDGLLRLGEWLQALAGFRKSGEYGIFSPLLEGMDPATASDLRETAFFEKVLDISQARKRLGRARARFADIAGKDPAFNLIRGELEEFCAWPEKRAYHLRQLAVARNALAAGNYPKAAALAHEAVISANMRQPGAPTDYHSRKEAREALNSACKGGNLRNAARAVRLYAELRDLRNAMAHGTSPDHNDFGQQTTLQDETRMQQRLAFLIDEAERIWPG